jgi:hypothetical protein
VGLLSAFVMRSTFRSLEDNDHPLLSRKCPVATCARRLLYEHRSMSFNNDDNPPFPFSTMRPPPVLLYWRRRGLTILLLVVIVVLIFWFALVPDLVRLEQPVRRQQSRIADVERKVTNGRQSGGKAGDGALRGMPPGNSFKGERGALSLYTTRDGQLNGVPYRDIH